MICRSPKLWMTVEEDAFLRALLPEYMKSSGQSTCAIIKHKEAVKHWFRWQTNSAHLAHSVKQKHTEVLVEWKHDRELAKVGLVEELDDDAKIQRYRAFNKLGSHLDQKFCHLSYKTGGLKFTCIAGGCNPSTGEVMAANFHLGETDTGAEFSACYPGFLDIQITYADFVMEAVDFSCGNNGALSEPTVSPPIMSPAVAHHDELPSLPAVPDIQAAILWPQLMSPQMLSPSLLNKTAGGATTGTAIGTSDHLTPLTAEGPKDLTVQHANMSHRNMDRHSTSLGHRIHISVLWQELQRVKKMMNLISHL
ncbi:uncharacterized protein HD556DRAFT_1310315 [Suillus plorans]|uniref:Uncharacterized protein n=1 Tax=Suillus plorans TaxID=116603 RepID=A0A9P7DED0_9AGAM|nr:uncharacterized protein HD556DRAFT_1310315 [Suillus plorans]KAG1790769.1 hypothetical protein HD556DRAFT_1310315 [Suillus plorans]